MYNNIFKSQNDSQQYRVVFVTNKFFVVLYLLKEKMNVFNNAFVSDLPSILETWKRRTNL